jgi:hypothetical protein
MITVILRIWNKYALSWVGQATPASSQGQQAVRDNQGPETRSRWSLSTNVSHALCWAHALYWGGECESGGALPHLSRGRFGGVNTLQLLDERLEKLVFDAAYEVLRA